MIQTSWIDYRPEIKILDCTIRDGGLINNHMFDDSLVKAVYKTCIDAGIDYMELGYKNDKNIFASDKYGQWKFCDEIDIRRVIGENDSPLKLSVMADAEKSDYKRDILPKDQSILDMIRVATYIHQIPTAVDMIKDAKDKGYEVTANLMAVSTVRDKELQEALDIFAESDVDAIILVDSFGVFHSEQIRDYLKRYQKAVKGTGKEIGIHTHNNMQLAFANTIEAISAGATRLDATMNGIRQGAGNCPMELLLSFLKNPKFKLRPILRCIQDQFVPLRNKIEWGCLVPYIITAHFNQHPRSAIELRNYDQKDNYIDFYDRCNES